MFHFSAQLLLRFHKSFCYETLSTTKVFLRVRRLLMQDQDLASTILLAEQKLVLSVQQKPI